MNNKVNFIEKVGFKEFKLKINRHFKIDWRIEMIIMDLIKNRFLSIGCLISIFLCLTFLIVPLHETAAMQSEEKTISKLVEGAKKEGKVVLYTTSGTEEAYKIIRKFMQRYPFIKATFYRTGSEKLMIRSVAEHHSNKFLFDVIWITSPEVEILKEKGVLGKYFSAHRDYINDKDPEGYWTDAFLTINTIGYNTRLVSPQEAPKTMEDLLDPKWKGKIGMDTKAFYWFAALLKIMGEEKGLEYMKKLSEQDIQFRTGKTLNTQFLSAGEMSIGITLLNYIVEAMKMKGAPVEWIAIEPVIAGIHPAGISSNAPHPNAAKLLLEWILSREGQKVLAGTGRIPSRIDVDPLVPKLKKGLKIAPYDSSIAKDYQKYVNLYRKVLMKK
ncbi:ABC transporter substrate-binding protein [Thermodesulfobacteriota bacterium]